MEAGVCRVYNSQLAQKGCLKTWAEMSLKNPLQSRRCLVFTGILYQHFYSVTDLIKLHIEKIIAPFSSNRWSLRGLI